LPKDVSLSRLRAAVSGERAQSLVRHERSHFRKQTFQQRKLSMISR
jgi:hypothetical protein